MLRAYFARAQGLSQTDSLDKLSSYRRERLSRISRERQRELSLSAELLLIEALNTLGPVGLPLDIHTQAGGKPILGQGPCFSLSHSGELVFCTLSDEPVGADVQKLLEKEPEPRLLDRCLSQKERELYRKSGNKRELFSLLWSLKESYAKMDGAGLGPLHPGRISIELGEEGQAGVSGSGAKLSYRLEGGYVFAVCSGTYSNLEAFLQLKLRPL